MRFTFLTSRFTASVRPLKTSPVPGRLLTVHTYANAQDALAVYRARDGGTGRGLAIIVLMVTGRVIARMVVFQDPGRFPPFGLRVG